MKLYIFNRVGFEVEGLSQTNDDKILDLCRKYKLDCDITSDGSIKGDGDPTEIKFDVPIEKYDVIQPFFDELSEIGFYENGTCGSHLHLSFRKPIYMTMLSIPDSIFLFQKMYRQKFEEKRKYVSRLYNKYSEEYFEIGGIIDNQTGGNRYRAVNFESLYKHSFGTVEIRILPYMESGTEYKEAVATILDIVSNIIERKLDAMKAMVGYNKIRAKKSEIRVHSEYSFSVNSDRIDLPPIYGSFYKTMPLILGQIENFNRIRVGFAESEYDEERMYTINIPNICKVYETLFGENKDILVCMTHEGHEHVRFKNSLLNKGMEIMSSIFQYKFNSDMERTTIDILRNGSSTVPYKYYIKSLKLLKKLDKMIMEMGL